MSKAREYWETDSHKQLLSSIESVKSKHLRVLLNDEERNKKMIVDSPLGKNYIFNTLIFVLVAF